MIENPWRDLPQNSCVLPDDEPFIRAFNARLTPDHDHYVHTDKIVPEAFMGDPQAPVLVLSNNPGFGKGVDDKQKPEFAALIRKNLLHKQSDYPFIYLAPSVTGFGKKWWQSKLKGLIERFDERVVARSVLNVVYFPYPSRLFGHRRLSVPSQDYSFHLVAEAVKRRAVVVLMRTGLEPLWKKRVPGLNGYDRLFRVRYPIVATVSPKNCADFEKIVDAIKQAEAKR